MTQARYDKGRPSIPAAVEDAVRNEYHYRCAICGRSGSRLQLHHIDENRENNDPMNLILLCPNCHLMDQHNPTVAIDIGILRLFRRYKDPVLLTPQFQPLYKRMAFLDEIPDWKPVDPMDDWKRGTEGIEQVNQEVHQHFSGLIYFVRYLKMGGYYALELEKWQQKLFNAKVRTIIPPRMNSFSPAVGEQFERQWQIRIGEVEAYFATARTVREKAHEVVMEMLRYQEWPLPKRPEPEA